MNPCEHCGKRLTLRRYCSPACANAAKILPRLTLTCARCSEPFETRDRRRVYCSHPCYSAAKVGKRQNRRPGQTQGAIMANLRATGGAWIDGHDLTRRVYGSDDMANRRALQIAMCRLRRDWEARGLVIEYTRRGRNGGAYRLIRDVQEGVAA